MALAGLGASHDADSFSSSMANCDNTTSRCDLTAAFWFSALKMSTKGGKDRGCARFR